jgi:phospholipid transport system substrate-binding protein
MKKLETYSDSKVFFEGETVEEDYASVQMKAKTTDGTTVPIEYRLHKVGGENGEEKADWLVYDVKIEGVSMVQNYRTQFNEIVVGSSYKKLVEKLKKKVSASDG